MEEDDLGTVTTGQPVVKRQRLEQDTSCNVSPMDCSGNDVSDDSLPMNTLPAPSALLPDYITLGIGYDYCELELLCKHLKIELEMYDSVWKSIIPSLALWSHMRKLEFNFDKEDNYLLSHFGSGLDVKEKMKIVERALKDKCTVNLVLYDIWSEESEEFLIAEDGEEDTYGKIISSFKYDGKLVETTDGSTTIYIARYAFGHLTQLLWMEMGALATIWNRSGYIYNLLKTPLTMMDELNEFEIERNLISCGWPFLDMLVSMKDIMEPKYHPLFRKEEENTLKQVWAYHTKKEMLHYPHKEFPFGFFRDYSESIYKLFQSKVKNSRPYGDVKKIDQLHRQFMSSPDTMAARLESESDTTSFLSLRGDPGKKLRQMCTKALEEYERLKEHYERTEHFSKIMSVLFETTGNDEKLKREVDLEVKHLMSQSLISDGETHEGFITSLESFMNKRLGGLSRGLSRGFAVLGILLYDEGTSLTDDKLKEFIRTKVEGSMSARREYLTEIWRDSCYDETLFRDLHDPARVLSWCDDETEFPMSEEHKDLPLKLKLAEDDFERLKDKLNMRKN